MMNCRQAYSLIQDLLDDRPGREEHALLTRHIEACPRCSGDYRSLQALTLMLDEMEPEVPPQGFAERIIGRLKAAGRIVEPAARARAGGLLSWVGVPVRAPLAAAVFVLIVLWLLPAMIRPLEGVVGKGTVFVTDTYLEIQDRTAGVDVFGRIVDSFEKNVRMLKTIVLAGLSLLAQAGEVFMLPALAMVVTLLLGALFFFRAARRRGAQHASFSF